MDAPLRQAFEQEMASNEALAAEVAAFEDAQHIIHIAGDAAFIDSLREIEEELDAPGIRPLWRRPAFLRGAIGIAAAILLLLAGLWLFQPASSASDTLFAENFQAYPPPAKLRGQAGQDQLWESARSAYLEENYSLAASQFESLLAQGQTQHPLYLVHFYAGVSQLAQHPPRLADAIRHLLFVTAMDSDYFHPAQWYLALAFLKNGEPQKAKALLEKISEESSYRKKAVDALLEELGGFQESP